MAVRSVYLPEPLIEHDQIRIKGDEHHHLIVARVEPNDVIDMFDGKGTVWTATVDSIGKRETVVRVNQYRKIQPDPVELIVAAALIRIASFELALEKVVEVGVTRIVPFTADRSNAAPAAARHERWVRILIE